MATHQKQEVRVHIRWMIRRDFPEVLAIETESFRFPWLEEDFIRCLRQRNCIGMVAEHDERVVGFMVYELDKSCISPWKCAKLTCPANSFSEPADSRPYRSCAITTKTRTKTDTQCSTDWPSTR
jgi:ribosomal protein S18 acetylase RimI-like enzyme